MDIDHLVGDILAERRLAKEDLGTALSSLLSVAPENIVVYGNWQELPEKHDPRKVYCRYWHLQGGEFHTVIDLPDTQVHGLSRNSTASRFAMLLGCRLLVDDGSINPYTFLLYDEKGGVQPVSINVAASDVNEFQIERVLGK
jgi:hypothetical protein